MDPRTRRDFLRTGLGAAAGLALSAHGLGARAPGPAPGGLRRPLGLRGEDAGKRVILVRFGGGVRRRETLDPAHTHSPYLLHRLVPRGTLYESMEIDAGFETSHGQGTLHLLTGTYDGYINRNEGFLGEQFEPTVPTLFEELRAAHDVPQHQALMVNNENRLQEEYFTASSHPRYGLSVRAEALSMHRYRLFRLQERLAGDTLDDAARQELEKQRDKLLSVDPRAARELEPTAPLAGFWRRWHQHFGDELRGAPRGDRLLTEMSIWALRHLRPRLLSIHYTDPDYVHWGNPAHYTLGIEAIDQGLQRLVEAVEADEELRENTVFVVVPDCGRDHNRLMSIPFQHHFGSKESRRIWALFFGPGIAQGQRIDRRTEQVEVGPSIARWMDFPMKHAQGSVLEEVWA